MTLNEISPPTLSHTPLPLGGESESDHHLKHLPRGEGVGVQPLAP